MTVARLGPAVLAGDRQPCAARLEHGVEAHVRSAALGIVDLPADELTGNVSSLGLDVDLSKASKQIKAISLPSAEFLGCRQIEKHRPDGPLDLEFAVAATLAVEDQRMGAGPDDRSSVDPV